MISIIFKTFVKSYDTSLIIWLSLKKVSHNLYDENVDNKNKYVFLCDSCIH